MNNKKNIIIFDKPYSKEKIKEGLRVQQAVITGACNKCPFLRQCESDNTFIFPATAACMKIKLLEDNNE